EYNSGCQHRNKQCNRQRSRIQDVRMSVAFIFPGQGSQSVGMLDSLAQRPEVAGLLTVADEVLGEPLSRLIAQGPAEELALTTNTQPAMLLAGLACLAAWRSAGGFEPDFVAGHSL